VDCTSKDQEVEGSAAVVDPMSSKVSQSDLAANLSYWLHDSRLNPK
jgi:hypothetical protein